MPTRFKNASTLGSPQYPAAIAAGIRRGQEPAGIMAGRGIGTARNVGAKKVGRELLRPLVWIMVHEADRQPRRKGYDCANLSKKITRRAKGTVWTRCSVVR